MSGGAAPRLSYIPTQSEIPYYDGLFATADVKRAGTIGGGEAVAFFSRSQLPVTALKDIWTAADQPPSNFLDKPKFAVALRLIQLQQNGVQGQGPNLQAPTGASLRPVFFQGVSGSSVPLPGSVGGSGESVSQSPSQPPSAQTSPQRPPVVPGGGGGVPPGSMALTAQDPYSLPPQEQARYEDLFKDYVGEDGFVSGAAAVQLFGKSGLPQQHLATIWTMVDTPVDNKLDRLEFALAMHLIVCATKKNLPIPPSLPITLKQLKAQQQQPDSEQQSVGPPQSIQIQPGVTSSAASVLGAGSVSGDLPPPQQPAPSGSSLSGLQGPPPLQPTGGLSTRISDAFDGLSVQDTGADYMGNNPVPAPAVQVSSSQMQPMAERSIPSPTLEAAPAPSPVAAAAPSPVVTVPVPVPVPSTEKLAGSYNMGDSNEELGKLKVVLQKLQAENVSLKAQLGGMTEEEREVQKHLSATVAEIAELSTELTETRAKVLAAKSRLIGATAELNAAKEKKGVITDLIAEANETVNAINEAHTGVEEAVSSANAASAPPPAPVQVDGDFFDFGAPTPLPADSGPGFSAPPADNLSALPPAPPQTENGFMSQAGRTLSYESTGSVQYTNPPPAEVPQQQVAPETVPPYDPNPAHNRNASAVSLGFDQGMIMGAGGSVPQPPPSFQAPPPSVNGGVPTMDDVNSLKQNAKEAEDVARDAEESRRALTAQLEELRRVADEAEQEARKHTGTTPETKKKKRFGRGGKKADAKEAERLAMDAKTKKEQLLAVQSQVNDANTLAAQTRQEAERLRNEAEETEIKAASAASMNVHPPVNGGMPPAMGGPPQASGYASQPTNPMGAAYGAPPPLGQQPTPDYGGGFDASVMGGGNGVSIPTPAATAAPDDPWASPFG